MNDFQLLCCTLALSLGCTAASLPEYESVEGASHLAFICVDDETGTPMGPIDGCGCHVFDEALDVFTTMGSVECLCVLPGGAPVALLETEDCAEGRCPSRGDGGDFVPASEGAELPEACVAQGRGKLAALIASGLNRSLSVMLVDQPTSANRLLDASRSVPGQTSHFVDDVQVGVFSHPNGRAYFSVQAMSGRLAVFESTQNVLPNYERELGIGSVTDAAVWKADGLNLGVSAVPDGLFVLDEDRTTVYEFDLAGVVGEPLDLVLESRNCYSISSASDASCVQLGDGFNLSGDLVSDLAIAPDGRWLVLSMDGRPSTIVFDREAVTAPRLIEWAAQDPECDDGYIYEWVNGACRSHSDCIGGQDLNGDGFIDLRDATCSDTDPVWTVPECWDGEDNDNDGLVDRQDPGCDTLLDRAELDRETGSLCDNSLDDDLDGLVDLSDPGCVDGGVVSPFLYESAPECGDGVDNDGDGLTDFDGPTPDTGCSHAGDRSELSGGLKVGLRQVKALRAPRFGESAWQIVAVDEFNGLYGALLNGPNFVHLGRDLKADAHLIETRHTPGRADTIALDWDGGLAMWSFQRKTPLTVMDQPLFGARPGYTESAPILWERMQSGYGGGFEFLYRIEKSTAYTHTGLAGQCSALICDDSATCPVGGTCFEGVCVAVQCGEIQCPSGATCVDGACLADCAEDRDCFGQQVCDDGACVNRCSRASDGQQMYRGAPIELDESTWFETPVVLKGTSDPALFVVGDGVGDYAEVGRRLTSALATTQLTGVPNYSIDGRNQTFDPNASVFFCDLGTRLQDEETPAVTCAPAGYLEEFGGYRRMSLTERDTLYPASLTSFDEVELAQDYFRGLDRTSDFYTLVFEGTLPASRSKHGIHGGQSDDGWRLVDPKANFCETGVQVGDVVLIDGFRLRDGASIADCAQWITPALDGPPDQRLEPLRYRVAGVGVRGLELIQDERTTYHQLPRSVTQDAPHPADALGAPPIECVVDGFTYEVRVQDNFWLVESGARGYQHPWRKDGDQCRVDSRDKAASRLELGQVFDDGLVRFSLGQPVSLQECDGAPCQPYMIGSVLSFGVINRDVGKTGGVSLGAASDMVWSAFDDRLYVLDVAGQTVIQIGGLSSEASRYFETNRLE